MDDEDIFKQCKNKCEYGSDGAENYGRSLIGFIRKVCDQRENIILEHESHNRFITSITLNIIIKIKIIQHVGVVGISCYSICFTTFGTSYGHRSDYVRNIPYIPQTVLDLIPTIQLQDDDVGEWIPNTIGHKHFHITQCPTVYLAKFKKQIVDKLNEDPTYHELSGMNIVHELQQLKIENEKHHKTKQKYKTKLSEMKLTIL